MDDQPKSQHDGDAESSNTTYAPQPDNCWFNCDCCERLVPQHEARHNCQECHDFDYCEKCVRDAALIHPGHSFTRVDAPGPVPESEGDIIAIAGVEETSREPDCESCTPLTRVLSTLRFALDSELNPEAATSSGKDVVIKWSLRLSRLIEATQRDCPFCCFFLHTFFRKSNGEFYAYTEQSPWYARPSEHDKERMELVQHCMGTLTRLKRDHFDFDVYPICSRRGVKPWDFDKLRFKLAGSTTKHHSREELKEARVFHSAGVISAERHVYAVKGDPASHHITSRPPNPSPASPHGIEQIKAWLHDCEQNHGTTCRPSPTPDALPSLLIDVSNPTTLHLHQTTPSQTPTPRYAALSYCWGGPQPFQTTTSTLPTFYLQGGGFPPSALPQTLRDAVHMTQHLGLQYLWVDALCIVQDSPQDKFRELARMSAIYKHACVTLVAARADSAGAGFLQDRADPRTGLWRALVPVAYPLPSAETRGLWGVGGREWPERGGLYLLEESESLRFGVKDPIAERAWCLQERVLSPRVVGFGRWTTWRCNRVGASDGGFYREDEGDRAVRRLTRGLVEEMDDVGGQGKGLDHFRTAQLLETWRGIVQDYTRRKLAFSTDKLPAIAGIAREMGRLTGMEYLAGLWKENMLHDLMWFARTHEWRMRPTHTDEYPRAPTWSWASVEAPILCDAVTGDATPLARVLNCNVQGIDGKSTYDIVAGGTVEILGPLGKLQRTDVLALLKNQNYSPAPPISNDVQEWYKQLFESFGTSPEKEASMDDVEAALPEKVFGLMLFERDWTNDRWDAGKPKVMETCYFGLLLQEVDTGTYERIGAFWNDTSEFLDQTVSPWTESTVLLV